MKHRIEWVTLREAKREGTSRTYNFSTWEAIGWGAVLAVLVAVLVGYLFGAWLS